jgi:hypothetical protein
MEAASFYPVPDDSGQNKKYSGQQETALNFYQIYYKNSRTL